MRRIAVSLVTRWVIAIALALAAAPLLTGCASRGRATAPKPARPEQQVVQADELLRQGRDEEALALLTRAIERNPTLTIAHLKMADIFEGRGDYAAAERSFATAAEQEPANFDAQYGHGRMLQLLQRLAEAVRAYLRALAIRPTDFGANLNLATTYLQLDGPQQALPYAQQAVRIDPASGAARANLGAVYSALGMHREAVSEYESAAELMELTPPLLLNLAESQGKIERYQEMLNTLTLAMRLQPTAVASERMGYALFKLRRYDESHQAFERSLSLDENHYPAMNGLGVLLLNQYILSDRKDVEARDQAIAYLRRSLRINERQTRIVDLISTYGR